MEKGIGSMEKENCSSTYYDYGGTDSSKFGEFLPWTGLYITAASLTCVLLMTVDLFRSFKWKKPWVASKFFVFNATTLTLLAVATKLPSDVTGAMPGLIDQLAKLSGLFLLCVAMNHAMPSLGAMDGLAASSNMIALGIMVVTMFVNIWIQLSTGLISRNYFRYIYRIYSVNMLLLLLFLVSHSLTVSASRRILYRQYYVLHEDISREISNVDARARFSDGKLEEYISKYWLMALTSSPDYALRTSELSSVSANLNIYLFSFTFTFGIMFVIQGNVSGGDRLRCFCRSDYEWSIWAIFLVQLLAIAVGSLSSYLRGSNSNLSIACSNLCKIENYRYQLMKDWNDRPLPGWISNKRCRQAMRILRGMLLCVLIILQILVITISRIIIILFLLIGIIIIFPPYLLFTILQKCCNRRHDGTTNARSPIDMSKYVLFLDDKKDIEQSKLIAQKWQNYPTMWIERGGTNQPKKLNDLLRNYSLPEAFGAVREFYSIQIPPAGSSREPLNCWALHIVTLASILYATSPRNRENLMLAVGESLRYIRLVDENMDERGTRRMLKAAYIAWEKLYLQNRWMNVDFDQTTSMRFSDLITHLFREAREAQNNIQQDGQCNNNEICPISALIANCMYTTTDVILKSQKKEGSSSNLAWSVERLDKVMVGLLGACLTNLPLAIFKHCSSGTFGLREEKVREAATILGETREILKLLENLDLEVNYPKHKEYFDNWCGPQSCA